MTDTGQRHSALEVFRVFLGLGLTSFGGPVAHLGYFREAFVVRRRWLGERAYADLVALCQFLPGPASSQVGMAIGLMRAGYAGMAAAWLGFTLPSAIALVGFGYALIGFGIEDGAGWIAGLKAAAVAVVAHAVLGMARSLAPDRERASLAALGLAIALLVPGPLGQVGAIVAAGAVGFVWLRGLDVDAAEVDGFVVPVGRGLANVALASFAVLLVGLPLLAQFGSVFALFDSFYRAGALVFGGGHVVLPLLEAELVPTGVVTREAFLAGYGATQAVPGPLFTFAAFLGTVATTLPNGMLGALLALVAIFLPSALLILGGLPYWQVLRGSPQARRLLAGINAGVVGLLAAALYDPVFTAGITSAMTLVLAAIAFLLLASWKAPAWLVVIAAGLAGAVLL
jgi:chromate transporter